MEILTVYLLILIQDENGVKLKNREALKKSIEMGVEVEEYIQQFLKLKLN